jgi:hypothetical protein
MMTANDLITDALLQTGIIAQEGGPYGSQPAYMNQQAFILLNDIINEWGGATGILPYNNQPIHFNFIQNQSSYTFGPSPIYFYNTQPIMDVITFTYFLDYPTNKVKRTLQKITEFQYANILYPSVGCYPSEYLLRRYPDYSELIIQSIPSQNFSATIICKQRLTALIDPFQDLSELPPHYRLCLKYRLMLDLWDAYGVEPTSAFLAKYQKCMDSMTGSNKMDLTLQPTESLCRRRWSNYLFGISGL